jgi:hypothetical protein
MPPEQGVGGDEERLPRDPRKEAARGGEEHAVSPSEGGSSDLAAEHLELVSKHEELHLGGPVEYVLGSKHSE